MPIFTHAGCNTGGRHGKADGQSLVFIFLVRLRPGGRPPGLDPGCRRAEAVSAQPREQPGSSSGRPGLFRMAGTSVRGSIARISNLAELDRREGAGRARDDVARSLKSSWPSASRRFA